MFYNQSEEESSEEEDNEEINEHSFKPAFVVIAIDTHPRMFVKKENDCMPFRNCLEACVTLAESLLFTTNKRSWSQFAVVLAREEHVTFIDFRNNIIDTIKLLKKTVKKVDKELVEEFQRKGDFDLATFFLTSKKLFHDIKSPFYKRTLIYITDDDDPVHDANKKFTALNEVKTFAGSQITFQVLPTRLDFDYTNFYNELFSLLNNSHVEEICEDKEGLIEKLTSIIVKSHTGRKLCVYPFKDDPSYFFNCFLVDIIHESKLNNIKVRNDGKAVKVVKESDYSAEYFIKVNNIEITFDLYDEKSTLDQNLPLGLTLLYISKKLLDVGYVIGKPFLLGHKEDILLPHFKRIWQFCASKDKVLICARKIKQPGKIRYVQLDPITMNGNPMFLGKNIPFSNEISILKSRNHPEQESSKEKKDALEKLVDCLTFEFDAKMIPDATYKKREAYVKSKLLDEPMEQVNSLTFDATALEKYLKEPISLINAVFTFEDGKKRKAPASRAPRKKK